MGLIKAGNRMKHLLYEHLHQENRRSKLCWSDTFCGNLMANSKDLHKIRVAVRTA